MNKFLLSLKLITAYFFDLNGSQMITQCAPCNVRHREKPKATPRKAITRSISAVTRNF